MVFDVTCAIIFVLCVLVGYLKGIVRAAFLVGCVAAAYYLSQPLAAPIGGFVHRWIGLTVHASLIAGQALGGLAVYAVCSIVSDLLARWIERDEHGFMKAWNRHLGALVGLATGAALIFAAVCVADLLVKSQPRRDTYLFRTMRSSRLRQYVSDVNPLRKKQKGGKTELLSDLSSLEHCLQSPIRVMCGERRIELGFTGGGQCSTIQDGGREEDLSSCWRWCNEIPRRAGRCDGYQAG